MHIPWSVRSISCYGQLDELEAIIEILDITKVLIAEVWPVMNGIEAMVVASHTFCNGRILGF